MRDVLRVLIADDEPLVRESLRTVLEERADIEIADETEDGPATIRAIERGHPDIVLLDVRMPGADGFEVARSMPGGRRPVIIIVTAHDEYALDAFDAQAVDYVLKPVEPGRLHRALDRAAALVRAGRMADVEGRLEQLVARLATAPAYARRVAVRVGGRVLLLDTREVWYVTGARNYVRLHTERRLYLARETLTGLERVLDRERFVRIHRSTIVNFGFVREIRRDHNGTLYIVMPNGVTLTTSEGGRRRVWAMLDDWTLGTGG